LAGKYTKAYERFLVRLATARLQAGMTQAQVAKRLGRPQSFVSKIESGERRVDVIELKTLAGLYSKNIPWFVR
jgi:transcriptional regulator with XRE-family HTH domain